MSKMLRSADLNLLPVLQALLTEASVTRAAARLGMSQPATSQALSRLRHLLGDPLLVKVGRTMRLTPRAEALVPILMSACAVIEDLLSDRAFSPRSARRVFTVATPDYMALLLAPFLMRRFTDQAPGVSVRFLEPGTDIREKLSAGEVDVAIIVHVDDLFQGLHVKTGYRDRLVAVVAADHSLAKAGLGATGWGDGGPLLALDPALVSLIDTDKRSHAGSGGVPERGVFSTPNLLILALLAARSQGVAVLPRALAVEAAKMVPLAIVGLPPHIEGALDICLAWSPVYDADKGHRWFRDALDDAMIAHFGRVIPREV